MSSPPDLDTYHRERSASIEAFNRSQLGLDRESEIRGIKRRFRSIMRRYEWATWRRRYRALAVRYVLSALIGVAAGGGIYLAVLLLSPWPVGVTVKHLVAGINCSAARTVGLAPAVRDGPGYWSRNDADNDGVACEPWRQRR